MGREEFARCGKRIAMGLVVLFDQLPEDGAKIGDRGRVMRVMVVSVHAADPTAFVFIALSISRRLRRSVVPLHRPRSGVIEMLCASGG